MIIRTMLYTPQEMKQVCIYFFFSQNKLLKNSLLLNLNLHIDHKDPSSDRGPQHQRGGFNSPWRDRYQDYTQVILVTTWTFKICYWFILDWSVIFISVLLPPFSLIHYYKFIINAIRLCNVGLHVCLCVYADMQCSCWHLPIFWLEFREGKESIKNMWKKLMNSSMMLSPLQRSYKISTPSLWNNSLSFFLVVLL